MSKNSLHFSQEIENSKYNNVIFKGANIFYTFQKE